MKIFESYKCILALLFDTGEYSPLVDKKMPPVGEGGRGTKCFILEAFKKEGLLKEAGG